MQKKPFKVVQHEKDKPILKEVKGYFTWINDIRVFIYFETHWREWYVIDLDTGFSFADGRSLYAAKEDGFNKLSKFKKQKTTEDYKKCRFLYQKLLSEEKKGAENESK